MCWPCRWRPLAKWGCSPLMGLERWPLSKEWYWSNTRWRWASCYSYISSVQLLRIDSDKVFCATTPQTLVSSHSIFKSSMVFLPTFPTGFYWTKATTSRCNGGRFVHILVHTLTWSSRSVHFLFGWLRFVFIGLDAWGPGWTRDTPKLTHGWFWGKRHQRLLHWIRSFGIDFNLSRAPLTSE